MNCAISVVGDGSMIARLAGNLRPGRKLGSTRGIVILSVAKDLRLFFVALQGHDLSRAVKAA